MQISKVGHTKPAVGKKDDVIKGFLYEDPSKNGAQNIGARLEKLGRSAKILYNVFSPIQEGKEPNKPEKDKYKDIEKYNQALQRYEVKIKNYRRKENLREGGKVDSVNRTVKGIIVDDFTKSVNDENRIFSLMKKASCPLDRKGVDELVTIALRKSLYDSAAGVKAMLNNLGRDKVSDADRTAISGFIKAFEKDYNKYSLNAGLIKKSIENMNVTVQAEGDDFSTPVPPVKGKKTDHKYNEKNALNAFLKDYAVLDEDCRMDQLDKLRRIVDLYFAAPDGYEKGQPAELSEAVEKGRFDVWKKHEQGKKEEGFFVAVPEALLAGERMDEVEKVKLLHEFKESIRKRNISCYRYAEKVTEDNPDSIFFEDRNTNLLWIHHVENAVERILENRLAETCGFRLKTAYLREKVWKDIINFLSIKYIAIGKAVFNFGMQDVFDKGNLTCLGKAEETVKKGMTSFDLELIKARETLQREIAVSVMFSANNLARAAFITSGDKMEDILTMKEDEVKNNLKYRGEDGLRSVLQFFGGRSQWDAGMFENVYGTGDDGTVKLLTDLKNCIYSLRNRSFHFVTANLGEDKWNSSLVGRMFEKEIGRCITIEKDKMYSNNLPMFYPDAKIRGLLDFLYEKDAPRASQIPSFGRVIVRKNLVRFFTEEMGTAIPSFTDSETADKWLSSVYYLLKEVYYNRFIQSDKAKKGFLKAVSELDSRITDSAGEERAGKDFSRRIESLKNYSLAEICQQIMTEYNYQNTQRKVRTGKESIFDRVKFQHYPLLLNSCLAASFAVYVKNEAVLSFVMHPAVREMPPKENFLSDWTTKKYNGLVNLVKGKPGLQAWYITCRFLNGRMLNQLAGSLRSYVQYIESVERRASETGNVLYKSEKESKKEVLEAVRVVETCIILSSFESVRFEDYFSGVDDYVDYLRKYVDCEDLSEGEVYINAGGVPILNRNVLQAKLFAPDSVLTGCVGKVSNEDISRYLESAQGISGYRVKLRCDTEDDQKKLIEFQRLKNRVELRTLADYGEVINELLGQLVNWSFMRERDLMYFQLGFHYQCLMNGKVTPDEYRRIVDKNGRKVENAILYQIAALYINGLGVYEPGKSREWKLKAPGVMTSGKIEIMSGYSELITGKRYGIYLAGLELFEVETEHEAIIKIRDYIDHFKYYNTGSEGNNMSILDLYSEVFDRFFTYDMKYQKTVLNMLSNILSRHMIIASYDLGTGRKLLDSGDAKNRADIRITRMEASPFTFNLGKKEDKKKLKTPAKDKEYLETIQRILFYPNDVSEIYTAEGETAVTEEKKQKNVKSGKTGKGKKQDNGGSGNFSTGGSSGTNMGDLMKKFGIKF